MGFAAAIAQICRLETLPQLRTLVYSWTRDQHLKIPADRDARYIMADDEWGLAVVFVMLRGVLSEHRGCGANAVGSWRFREPRPPGRDVYKSFGFQEEGIVRDAICGDGKYLSLVWMSWLEGEYRRQAGGNG